MYRFPGRTVQAAVALSEKKNDDMKSLHSSFVSNNTVAVGVRQYMRHSWSLRLVGHEHAA